MENQSLVHGSKDLEMKMEINSERSDPDSSNGKKSNTQSPILPVEKEFKCKDCNDNFTLSRVNLIDEKKQEKSSKFGLSYSPFWGFSTILVLKCSSYSAVFL